MMRILKVLLFVALTIVVITLSILIFFRTWAAVRENSAAAEAAPSSGLFVSAGNTKVYVQETGSNTSHTVVFIHGTGAWGELWKDTVEPLAAAGFHTLTLDTPPFGFSEKPLSQSYSTTDQAKRIVDALQSSQITDATIVCHSFGCRAAIEASMTSQGIITSIVVVDPALEIREPGQQQKSNLLVKSLVAIKPLRNSLVATTITNPLLSKQLLESLIYNKAAATEERVKTLQQPLVVKDTTEGLGNWLVGFLAPSPDSVSTNPESYSAISMPVLIIWGEKDSITPLADGEKLHATITQSELVTIPDTGHIPYLEDPETFNAHLLKFLNSIN